MRDPLCLPRRGDGHEAVRLGFMRSERMEGIRGEISRGEEKFLQNGYQLSLSSINESPKETIDNVENHGIKIIYTFH